MTEKVEYRVKKDTGMKVETDPVLATWAMSHQFITNSPEQHAAAVATVRRMCPDDSDEMLEALGL